nr:hypothetical protein [uncultured Methanospirillum sp.]
MTAPQRMMIPNAENTFPIPAMIPCMVASGDIPASRPNKTAPPIRVKNGEIRYHILTIVISARVMTNAMRGSMFYSGCMQKQIIILSLGNFGMFS